MQVALLHNQLSEQLGQWIVPEDKHHLSGFSEIVAAILQAQSASISHWHPFLSHRDCQARSHMARLSYFVHNARITSYVFYGPLVCQFLQSWAGQDLKPSVLWDEYCLIEVCLVWGGRSITLAHKVIKHGSATVAVEVYLPVLEAAQAVLPDGCGVLSSGTGMPRPVQVKSEVASCFDPLIALFLH
jgi:hypothetical protein